MKPRHPIPEPTALDPMALRLTAARLALRATRLLREAHAITAAHDPIPGICRDCAAPYEITAEEVATAFAKKYELSTRCPPCRAAKRRQRAAEQARDREWLARHPTKDTVPA